ncbi:DUF5675 family protein [Desertivirga arenae]|uniref:DUF5675 family protein n=1 Tax=Desertivirga arenae TaxID=2810309 RepID=UPI001A97C93B|nr:DUF5675 family protein [Pedobacter sp. SYSU D00823]
MAIKVIRVAEGKFSTLSHLYLNDIFQCYLLEDKIRKEKIAGKTCIPEGEYLLKLNTTGGMNLRYKKNYPDIHKGMIEICGIPNFSLVYFHVGNYIDNTNGCLLAGHYWTMVDGDYIVLQSGLAYRLVYPQLLAALEKKDNKLIIENKIQP